MLAFVLLHTDVEVHQCRHQVPESHGVRVEQRREDIAMLAPVPRPVEQNLRVRIQLACVPREVSCDRTSTILAFKNGFLMYQVDVRKVRHQMSISFFPDSSRLLGLCL